LAILKTIPWKLTISISLLLILITLSVFPIFLTYDSWVFHPPDYILGGSSSDDSLLSLSISQNGEKIVVGGKNVYYLSKDNSTPIWTYNTRESEAPVISTAISSEGSSFAIGSGNGYLLYFEGNSSNPLWKYFVGHVGDWITSIDVSDDGFYIVAATKAGLLFFNKSFSTPSWNYSVSQELVEITSNGHFIVAGGNNNLTFFSHSSSTPLWNYTFSSKIIDISIDKNGNSIVVGCEDGMIYLFENHFPIPIWSYLTTGPITDVIISSTGQNLAVCDNNDYLYFFTNDSSLPLWTYQFVNDWELGIPHVSISGDGNYIFFNKDKFLRLFHRSNNNSIWVGEHGGQWWYYEEANPLISYNGDYLATILDGDLYFYYRLNPRLLKDYNNYFFWLFSIGYPSFIIYNTLIIYHHRKNKKRTKME